MPSVYTMRSADGTLREVSEEEYQQHIDVNLSFHNEGVVPTNKEERGKIIRRLQEPDGCTCPGCRGN